MFNEIFSYLLSRQESDPKVILFFEVRPCLHKDATIPQIRIITLQGADNDIPKPKPKPYIGPWAVCGGRLAFEFLLIVNYVIDYMIIIVK